MVSHRSVSGQDQQAMEKSPKLTKATFANAKKLEKYLSKK